MKAYQRAYRERNRDKIVAKKREVYVPRNTSPPGSTMYEVKLAGFRSGFERTLDFQLKSSGVKYSYETLKLPYTLTGNYNPDFILENGIIIEAKGYMDKDAKRKMEAVRRQHPDLDIRIVFMNADKKMPNSSRQTHGEWATRHGYKWADGKIPQEWLDERK